MEVTKTKEAYIIGGPNGAGKSTFVNTYLPEYIDMTNFVNADLIAAGISPLDHARKQFTAGKLMLKMIEEYKIKGLSFGFETTLAGKKWLDLINDLKASEYIIKIFFLDIASVALVLERIQFRIESGGHDIPTDTAKRRYVRSRYNFWHRYKDVADSWYLFNNTSEIPELIACKEGTQERVQNKDYYDFFTTSI